MLKNGVQTKGVARAVNSSSYIAFLSSLSNIHINQSKSLLRMRGNRGVLGEGWEF